jgi:hypothetical protein
MSIRPEGVKKSGRFVEAFVTRVPGFFRRFPSRMSGRPGKRSLQLTRSPHVVTKKASVDHPISGQNQRYFSPLRPQTYFFSPFPLL